MYFKYRRDPTSSSVPNLLLALEQFCYENVEQAVSVREVYKQEFIYKTYFSHLQTWYANNMVKKRS